MLRLVTSAAAPLQGSTYLDLTGCMRAHSAAVKDSDQVRSETGNTSKRNQIRPVSLGTRAVRETRRPAKEDDRSVKSSLPRRPCDVGASGRQYLERDEESAQTNSRQVELQRAAYRCAILSKA